MGLSDPGCSRGFSPASILSAADIYQDPAALHLLSLLSVCGGGAQLLTCRAFTICHRGHLHSRAATSGAHNFAALSVSRGERPWIPDLGLHLDCSRYAS